MSAALEHYPGDSDRVPFDREDSGLVDLACYLPYLNDATEHVPTLALAGKGNESDRSRFVHQHVYFTEPLYRQLDKPVGERDPKLVALRNAPYSQLVMRRDEELRMHRDMEEIVHPPPAHTLEKTLDDYLDLDIVGASVLAMREIRHPKPLSRYEQSLEPPQEIQALSAGDRMKILKSRRDRALESLVSPRAISPEVSASALRRIATHVGDVALAATAKGRLSMGEKYYPLKTPQRGYFRAVMYWILRDSLGMESIEASRNRSQTLQTGAEQVQLAA